MLDKRMRKQRELLALNRSEILRQVAGIYTQIKIYGEAVQQEGQYEGGNAVKASIKRGAGGAGTGGNRSDG